MLENRGKGIFHLLGGAFIRINMTVFSLLRYSTDDLRLFAYPMQYEYGTFKWTVSGAFKTTVKFLKIGTP